MIKKFICLTVICFILTSLSYGKEKIEFKLSYQYSLYTTQLKEEALISEEGYVKEQYWVQDKLIELNQAKEAIKGLFLEISYPLSRRLKLYGKAGINVTTSEFNKWQSLVTLYFMDEKQWDYPIIERPGAKESSYLGFSVGIGSSLTIYEKNGFRLGLKTEYLYQENKIEFITVDEGENWIYPWGYIDWSRQFLVNNLKSHQAAIAIEVSKRIGKVTLSGGPSVLWVETKYTGRTDYVYTRLYVPAPYNSVFHENTTDFTLKTVNQHKLGAEFVVSYALTENASLFLETQVVSQDKIVAGLKFKI